MPLNLEHVVPLQAKVSQLLVRCGRPPLDIPSRLLCLTTKSSRQLLFFTTCSTGLQSALLPPMLWFSRCTLSSVRPGQLGCLLFSALFWLHLPVQSLYFFFSFALVDVFAPRCLLPPARRGFCATLSFAYRFSALLCHKMWMFTCKTIATGYP